MDRANPPPPPVDDGEVDTAWDHPVRRVVAADDAAQLARPKCTAPASVWDMAALVKATKAMRSRGRFGAATGFVASATPAAAPSPAIVREGSTVRVVGARYPADRWTEEREEQERARRARQKPPRPTKAARTRGKKVRKWDGEGDYDD